MYALVWPDIAIDQLADAYLATRLDGRGEPFRRAVDALETELARHPAAIGESRVGAERIVYHLPASILYRIDEPARAVVVLAVRYHR